MTEKLYYRFPYEKEFDATVESCSFVSEARYRVILNRTLFYPEGGGQPGDSGYLGSYRVLDTIEEDQGVIHITDGPFTPGEPVHGVIDWDKRYDNMQQHSGEHLFSGLIHRTYGFDNVGFHMGNDVVTVDFNGRLTQEQLLAIQLETNKKVCENIPIEELFPTKEELENLEYRSKKELTGKVRIIRIEDGDTCACCGTHVKTTGEIGMVKATAMIHYKSGVRISILCGRRALCDYQKKQEVIESLARPLSTNQDRLLDVVEKIKQESIQKDMLINRLYQNLFELKLKGYPESGEPLVIFEEGLEGNQLRQLCTLLCQSGRGNVVLVCSQKEEVFLYAMGSESLDVRVSGKEMNKRLNGKGGGSAVFVQGTFCADEKEIKEVFSALHKKENMDGVKQ